MSERWGFFARRRALIGACLACAVAGGAAPAVSALASAPPSASTPPQISTSHRFQATSLAIPTAKIPVASAATSRLGSTEATNLHVATTATESSTCDGCKGQAVTMQVVYADHGMFIDADNAAAAWSAGCAHCEGWAVSMQIVITGAGVAVAANNRALATNAACLKCDTKAAAIQMVVQAPSATPLSASAMTRLRALRDNVVRSLNGQRPAVDTGRHGTAAAGVPTGARDAIRATTRRMQSVLSTDLHAISVSHRVVVRD